MQGCSSGQTAQLNPCDHCPVVSKAIAHHSASLKLWMLDPLANDTIEAVIATVWVPRSALLH